MGQHAGRISLSPAAFGLYRLYQGRVTRSEQSALDEPVSECRSIYATATRLKGLDGSSDTAGERGSLRPKPMTRGCSARRLPSDLVWISGQKHRSGRYRGQHHRNPGNDLHKDGEGIHGFSPWLRLELQRVLIHGADVATGRIELPT